MVKVKIHEHCTRVTRFNPLWVSEEEEEEPLLIYTAHGCLLSMGALSNNAQKPH